MNEWTNQPSRAEPRSYTIEPKWFFGESFARLYPNGSRRINDARCKQSQLMRLVGASVGRLECLVQLYISAAARSLQAYQLTTSKALQDTSRYVILVGLFRIRIRTYLCLAGSSYPAM